MRRLILFFLMCCPFVASTYAQNNSPIAMAYVLGNEVWLADAHGNSVYNIGLELNARQAARLFWSPDGNTLYIATRNGLFVTSAEGSAATRLSGTFGLTVAIARHGGAIYNLDVDSPQTVASTSGQQGDFIAFPLRETNLANTGDGRGKLINYIGEFDASAAQVAASHAGLLYARDNGIPGVGRPHLWATYGNALFYSCCFPLPGLGLVDVGTGEINAKYDATFIPGAAALNDAASRLAGETTDGRIRVIDLISAGGRDYELSIPGGINLIENMTWTLDDSAIYFAHRSPPAEALEVLPTLGESDADTRSANLTIWKLDLITGRVTKLYDFGDVYGVSSMIATRDEVFVVVVERNQALINAINGGQVPPNAVWSDPVLETYMPRSVLYSIPLDNPTIALTLTENVWGLAARPN